MRIRPTALALVASAALASPLALASPATAGTSPVPPETVGVLDPVAYRPAEGTCWNPPVGFHLCPILVLRPAWA
ncbi:hypothetical protein [Blastococcus mobilis]|uniref:Uncharacterized protein n=1 Tax=Blastococcus mobilis TaxID=1938746 RepID=A0A238ZCD0_9ACTN|nr:hypothetical protein [Blastococcus mobilis]SNR80601.1 hypothetical protein SAMN06272737_1278 [Blastococcus mobilis]